MLGGSEIEVSSSDFTNHLGRRCRLRDVAGIAVAQAGMLFNVEADTLTDEIIEMC